MKRKMDHPLAGFLLGAVGGLIGTLAMRGYWRLTSRITQRPVPAETTEDEAGLDRVANAPVTGEGPEAAPTTLGRTLYREALDETPDERRQYALSSGIHWGYGAILGGLYGALRTRMELPDAPGGLALGASAWLAGDELMVPLLGLADGPRSYTAGEHAQRLGAHLTYGVATAAVTHALFRAASLRPAGLLVGLKAWKGLARVFALYQLKRGEAGLERLRREAAERRLAHTRRKLTGERERTQVEHRLREAERARAQALLEQPAEGLPHPISLN